MFKVGGTGNAAIAVSLAVSVQNLVKHSIQRPRYILPLSFPNYNFGGSEGQKRIQPVYVLHKCINAFCQGDVPETESCQQQYQPILSKVLPPPQVDDNFFGSALTYNNDDRKYYSSLSLADLLLLLVYIPLDIFRHYSFFRSKKIVQTLFTIFSGNWTPRSMQLCRFVRSYITYLKM